MCERTRMPVGASACLAWMTVVKAHWGFHESVKEVRYFAGLLEWLQGSASHLRGLSKAITGLLVADISGYYKDFEIQ